jgi:hypothetical protein
MIGPKKLGGPRRAGQGRQTGSADDHRHGAAPGGESGTGRPTLEAPAPGPLTPRASSRATYDVVLEAPEADHHRDRSRARPGRLGHPRAWSGPRPQQRRADPWGGRFGAYGDGPAWTGSREGRQMGSKGGHSKPTDLVGIAGTSDVESRTTVAPPGAWKDVRAALVGRAGQALRPASRGAEGRAARRHSRPTPQVSRTTVGAEVVRSASSGWHRGGPARLARRRRSRWSTSRRHRFAGIAIGAMAPVSLPTVS